MTSFLGVPAGVVLVVLLALLAAALVSLAVVWARNPVLVAIGLRNIPRRSTQSTLIIAGLMLSTAIVAAALTVGDTVNYSITKETYDRLGRVDEVVQVQANERTPDLNTEQIAPLGVIPPEVQSRIEDLYADDPDVDGLLPILRYPAPVTNRGETAGVLPGTGPEVVTRPQVVIIGVDTRKTAGFEEDFVSPEGQRVDLNGLPGDFALANESARDALQLHVGDKVDVWLNGNPVRLSIAGFLQDRYVTGWTQTQPAGIVVSLRTSQTMVRSYGGPGILAISNRGGVRDSLGPTDRVIKAANTVIGFSRFEIAPIKRDRVKQAEELGSNMAAIFVVLGLFTIAAGMLLVFLILVMLAAERRTEMGMARAVGMTRAQLIEAFLAEGLAYSLAAAAAGAALGVAVSVGMTRAMAYIFHRFDVAIAFHVTWRSVLIAYALGVVLTYITVLVSAWRVSRLTVVAAIRDIGEPPGRGGGRYVRAAAAAVVAAGLAFAAWGVAGERAYLFGLGVSLALGGGAYLARTFGATERPVFSLAGIAVLALWLLVAGDTLSAITGSLDAGLDTFFVAGILMVAGATLVVVYNAELLLGSVRGVGAIFARAAPAVRTAVAFPLANKFRTGMTIAMLSLVVFALVMISTLNTNFRRLFLDPDARGGFDVVVATLPTNDFTEANGNKLGPLGEALDRAFFDTTKITSIARAGVGNPLTTQITQLDSAGNEVAFEAFPILGADPAFLAENRIGLQARARGFASDRDVWDAVARDSNNAVIDGTVVPGIDYGNVTRSRFTLDGYKSGTRSFDPIPIEIRDSATLKVRRLRIIGIMDRGPSEVYRGLWVNQEVQTKAFPALYSRYYLKLRPGLNTRIEARNIERTLASAGVQASSIRSLIAQEQRLNSAFFYLLQGFMALGLGVGLAALAVVAFRTVVERRQQVGLMRAIGFSRANVALAFLLESSFIALLGIVNGVWLALLLASRLLQSDAFSTAGFTRFYIPWGEVGLIAGASFAASVLTTLIPSQQAASVPVAEALRYE